MGYVTFTNVNSGKVLDVSSGKVENGRNILSLIHISEFFGLLFSKVSVRVHFEQICQMSHMLSLIHI